MYAMAHCDIDNLRLTYYDKYRSVVIRKKYNMKSHKCPSQREPTSKREPEHLPLNDITAYLQSEPRTLFSLRCVRKQLLHGTLPKGLNDKPALNKISGSATIIDRVRYEYA